MKCSARTKDGFECGGEALQGQPFCWAHSDDPETVARRAEARSAGGRASHAPRGIPDLEADLTTPAAILGTLDGAAKALVAGADPRTVNAIGFAARTALEAIKVGQHEGRLRLIEVRLGLREAEDAK